MKIEELHDQTFALLDNTNIGLYRVRRKLPFVRPIPRRGDLALTQLSGGYVAISYGQSVELWDFDNSANNSGHIVQIPIRFKVKFVVELTDGRLAIACDDGNLVIHCLTTNKQYNLKPYESDIQHMIAFPNHRIVVQGHQSIIIWNLETYKPFMPCISLDANAILLKYSDSQFVVSCEHRHLLYLYNIQTYQKKPYVCKSPIKLMTVLNDGRIVTINSDSNVKFRVWNLQTNQIVSRMIHYDDKLQPRCILQINAKQVAIGFDTCISFANLDENRCEYLELNNRPKYDNVRRLYELRNGTIVVERHHHVSFWHVQTRKMIRAQNRYRMCGPFHSTKKSSLVKFATRLHDYLVEHLPRDLHLMVASYLVPS